MKKSSLLLLLLITLQVYHAKAQRSQAADLSDAKKQIETVNHNFFRAFAKGDSSLLITCYTEDCWIMRPNAASLCGVDAPLEFFRSAYKNSGIRNGEFISVDLFGNGDDFITEEGFWRTFDAKNQPLDNGKFLVLWKRTSGGWKRFRDSFNSDQNK
ncbi:YybH family protein [Mucilaginibacter sp. HD30]